MRIFLSLLLLLTVSCKSGGGENGKEADVLNASLFEGTGHWRYDYIHEGYYFSEVLVFTGDECQYTRLNGSTIQSDRRLQLEAVGMSRMIGVNIANTDEFWVWDYSINGTTLTLCNLDKQCFAFIKQ